MTTFQAPAVVELTEEELKQFDALSGVIETAAEQDAEDATKASERGEIVFKRGVTEGPLVGLTPVFIDWETKVTPELSLQHMTLRQYLLATKPESLSITIGEKDHAQVFFAEEFPGDIPSEKRIGKSLIETLRFVCNDPNYVIVAHNAAFDTRAGVYLYDLPYPQNVWCTMEGAMGAWPELPGGFSLDNCSRKLGLPRHLRKMPLDLKWFAKARLAALDGHPYEVEKLEAQNDGFIIQCRAILRSAKEKLPTHLTVNVLNRILELYNQRDTECARELYYRQIARISPREQGVALRTHRQRKHQLCISADRLDNLVETLEGHAEYARKQAGEYLTEEQLGEVFNMNSGVATSVRYQRLRTVINEIKEQQDDEFVSSSLKKINPIMLSRNPGVQSVLEQTTRVGKMLSHKRRAVIFRGIDRVDVELGYMRAHTGRFSSPSVGKGFNLHNCPKHDKLVAEPVRKCYRVPPDMCLVRADLANVEYRIEGMLTKCKTVIGMFDAAKGGNIYNDPYCLAWKSMTGIVIDKKDPVRQVSKCLRRGTPVLTDTGFKPIESVSTLDRVWDGVSWVSHDGVVFSGFKEVLCLDGIWMTFDHPVLTSDGWMEAWQVARSTRTLNQGIYTVTGGLSEESPDAKSSLRVGDNAGRTPFYARTSAPAKRKKWSVRGSSAGPRLGALLAACETETSLATPKSFRISRFARNGSTDTLQSCLGATIQSRVNSPTMAVGASGSASSGTTGRNSSASFARSRIGMRRGPNWTDETMTLGMNRPTSESPRVQRTTPTNETTCTSNTGVNVCRLTSSGAAMRHVIAAAPRWRDKSEKERREIKSSLRKLGVMVNTKSATYDVTNAGPNHCFQAKETIVHNSAVLGLGFCMAVAGYARVLLGVLASKQVTEEGLKKIVSDNNWRPPDEQVIKGVRARLGGVSLLVITAAYHIHRTFNQSHPEFGEAAAWLVDTVSAVASQPEGLMFRDQARRVIDKMYTSTRAPDRDLIGLEIDDDPLFNRASIRVKCGPWDATVCWREPAARLTDFSGASSEKKLTIMKAMGFYKPFTKQLAIENVTQAAARNAMCMGVEELERMGWPDVIHIHDEIMIICKRDRQTVLAARDALTAAFGPNHKMPHKWAILVKPEEITVTESMWEEESDIQVPNEKNKFKGNDRWGKIERNEAGCLENLP